MAVSSHFPYLSLICEKFSVRGREFNLITNPQTKRNPQVISKLFNCEQGLRTAEDTLARIDALLYR